MADADKIVATMSPEDDVGEEQQPTVQPVPFRRMFRFCDAADFVLIAVGTIMSLANGVTLALFAIIIGDFFDVVNDVGNFQKTINDKALLFLYVGLASLISSYFQVMLFTRISERNTLRLRESFLQACLRQDISFFDSGKGELASMLAEDSVIFREALGEKFGGFFQFVGSFLGGLVVGFWYLPQLAAIILAGSPFMAVGGYLLMNTMAELMGKGLGQYAKAGGVAEETFTLIRTVTSLGAQPRRTELFREACAEAEKASIKSARAMGRGFAMFMGSMFATYGLAFFAGSLFVLNSRDEAAEKYPYVSNPLTDGICAPGNSVPAVCFASPQENQVFNDWADVCACPTCGCGCYADGASCVTGGTVIIAFFSVLIGAMSIGQAGPSLNAMHSGRVAAAKLFEVIDRKPEIVMDNSGKKLSEMKGDFKLRNLKFRYPSRPEHLVLDDVSFDVPKGKTVALVGQSGSGKSTIIQLLERFYDPEEGSISVDGVDLKDLDLRRYRNGVGYVSQEPVLFATSVRNNIAQGVPNASRAEIEAAAKAANAHDFIQGFPEGYDTFVGEGGAQLSGGQKQRIAIARAILKNPSVLLLDEATAALDNESERLVQQALDDLVKKGSRTTLVIAHRLSTIRKADVILVMEAGKVVEKGTHEELLNKQGGRYASLVALSDGSRGGGGSTVADPGSPVQRTSDDEGGDDVSTDAGNSDTAKDIKVAMDADAAAEEFDDAADDRKVPMSRVLKFAEGELWLVLPAAICSMINGATFPIFSYLFADISSVLYAIEAEEVKSGARLFSLLFLGLAVLGAIGQYGQNAWFGTLSAKMTTKVRVAMFEKYLTFEMGYFDDKKHSVGALTSTLATEAALVRATLADRTALMILNTTTLVGGLIVAFVASWQMSLVILATFPIVIISSALQIMALGGMAGEDQKELGQANAVLTEAIQGIRTVHGLVLDESVIDLYRASLLKPYSIGKRKAHVAGFGFGIGNSVQFFVYGLAFYVGGKWILEGKITFDAFLQSFFGILMSLFGLGQSAALAPDVAKGGAAVKAVFNILDRPSRIDPSEKDVGSRPSTVQGDIAAVDVDFSYPTRPHLKVLKSASVEVNRGETIALVGSSGSGKSTVVSLIERFYDVDSGRLTLDKNELMSLNLGWLRGRIGLVSQEPSLFDTTVRENVALGKPQGASEEEIVSALKSANAWDFIQSNLPNGLDEMCGAKGSQMSGGQKQRIAIARAIVRNPDVLLLDEATSALDEESQVVVQAAIDDLMKASPRTTVLIAHRLSTVRHAKKIFVFEQGHVIQSGSYDELRSAPGAFKKLVESQRE